MQLPELIRCLLAQPGSTETHPFGAEPDVYKVNGRIFAILSRGAEPIRISLKCDPDLAEALRRAYPAIVPGYHLSKRHWNTVTLDGSIPDDELLGMIDHSHELVADRRHPR
ncbi:MAG: MmcQ/YjbR family DNA-binding protein [Chloroflexota bacterium]|nr:MmcQ/YjbR family DNA-binding protein [Chloroflexota bacterium]